MIEGVKQHQRFFIRAELFLDKDTSQVTISLKPVTDFNKLREDAQDYEARQYEITAQEGDRLLRNIRLDQEKKINYSLLGPHSNSASSSSSSSSSQQPQPAEAVEVHNCVTWCIKHVELIGQKVPVNGWHTWFVLLASDVTRPQQPSSSSSSHSSSSTLESFF